MSDWNSENGNGRWRGPPHEVNERKFQDWLSVCALLVCLAIGGLFYLYASNLGY